MPQIAIPVVERILRPGPHFVKCVESDTFVGLYGGNLFRFNTHVAKSRLLWSLQRGRRVLRNGACVVGSELLVGDYWQNKDRSDVRIHRINLATGMASSFLVFPEGKVRHVHFIQRDPYTGRLWIGTGDEDEECLVLSVDLEDPRLQTVGGGSQRWRAVSVLFTEKSVIWGSDNHEGSNAIYRYDRESGDVHTVGPVIGPVYYSASVGGHMLFGTTVEKGQGDQDGFGRLYALSRSGVLEEVHAERKDRLPAGLFGYGMFEFADGPDRDGAFWVTLRGFRGGLKSMLCRLVH